MPNAPQTPKLRVAVFDPLAATRLGVATLMTPEADLVPMGGAADVHGLLKVIYRTRPHVVLLDDGAGTREGLVPCLQVKAAVFAPRVAVWSSCAHTSTVAASLAGADAIVAKSAGARELLAAIRLTGAGRTRLPVVTASERAMVAAQLEPRDRSIVAMRLAGTSLPDIAHVVGMTVPQLSGRVAAIVAALSGRRAEPVPRPLRAAA
jgi:DNA-binding NarL/FixJ family response regulator